MKKIALAALAALFALLPLSGCASMSGGIDTENKVELKMNKKYISQTSIHVSAERQTFFLFRGDGTGSYQHGPYYTIQFRYTLTGGYVALFYDGYTPADGYTGSGPDLDWAELFMYTENFLAEEVSYGNVYFYLCEDFLLSIPNYGK